ncbi:hypothetical protein DTL21_28190 [Bremerella cremea]|uniref:Uncharacterized protein n=1 Tax=Blastopirellula marina TaxID=124 RepID=A0A2S8F976_9BACT|nr:hypothetical protein C5Y83_28145 [Blastopirellula marina]RCS41853.1 hypothetical protein DTL21_28190 [Bremerella cremea]
MTDKRFPSMNSVLNAATLGYLDGLCVALGLVWTEAGMGYSISTRSGEHHLVLAQFSPSMFSGSADDDEFERCLEIVCLLKDLSKRKGTP